MVQKSMIVGSSPELNGIWDEMVGNYYKEMGWDRKRGKPLPETLRCLGLEEFAAWAGHRKL